VDVNEKITRLEEYKNGLIKYGKTRDAAVRGWLNQNADVVRSEIVKAGCFATLTVSPPPISGGLLYSNIDPFNYMFDPPYGRTLFPYITDMIDKTIGALRNPIASNAIGKSSSSHKRVEPGYAFIAMAIDNEDHQLADVLEAIKTSAANCNIRAERVDEVETNERITERILESIIKAEFVIVDLTKERPNVFWEAGFAHGLGKIPVYLARHGTTIHFDLKDYPIIIFRNMKELKEQLTKRFVSLLKKAKED
jgi:hypothetical protein